MSVRGPFKHSKCNASNSLPPICVHLIHQRCNINPVKNKNVISRCNIQYSVLLRNDALNSTPSSRSFCYCMIIQYNHTSVMKLGRVAAKFLSVGFATVVCLDVSSIISILGLAELTEVEMRHQLSIEKCRLVAWILQLMIPISTIVEISFSKPLEAQKSEHAVLYEN